MEKIQKSNSLCRTLRVYQHQIEVIHQRIRFTENVHAQNRGA